MVILFPLLTWKIIAQHGEKGLSGENWMLFYSAEESWALHKCFLLVPPFPPKIIWHKVEQNRIKIKAYLYDPKHIGYKFGCEGILPARDFPEHIFNVCCQWIFDISYTVAKPRDRQYLVCVFFPMAQEFNVFTGIFRWVYWGLAMAPSAPKSGLFVGLNKGHIVTKRELAPRPSDRKGVCNFHLYLWIYACYL